MRRVMTALVIVVVLAGAACTKKSGPDSAASTGTTEASSSSTTTTEASSSSTTTTTTEASTSTTGATTGDVSAEKQAFLDAGNAICADMTQRSAQIDASFGDAGPQTLADAQSLFDQNADLIEQTLTQLQALPQPPDGQELAAIYQDVAGLVDLARQMSVAAGNGDSATMKQLAAQLQTLQDRLNSESVAYGLNVCGS